MLTGPYRAPREMITMDGHTRPARRLVPDELEQVMRLARFRQAHPGVMVGAGRGWWQAVIPEPDGEQVITRHTLGQLLDRLDELIGG
jgi:protein-tyrosine-phosphatase